ncbi:MAG: outer membrane lipoprotein carrier protein LolA [Spirochaetales bacterium]|nr:outer membrane lipoprotein carrier protein LolA [Spirochaetales bacterium]
MRKIKVVILLLATACCLFASDALKEVDLTSGDYSFISGAFSGGSFVGDFRQIKAVKGSTRTFVSTGRIQIATGYGIVWYTEKPYASMLVVGKDVLIQKIRDGEPSHLDMAQNPIYTQIATSLECVFSADFSVMDQMFTTFLSGGPSSWELRLVPKSKSVASFMESIEMKGSDMFESLTLYETTGDSIRYEFSGLENRELTDEELKVYSL